MKYCPCGSNLDYGTCCGVYHNKQAIPPNPEALMRSRYSAYTMANVLYIKETMKEKPLLGFDAIEAEKWAKSVLWLQLEVKKSYQTDDETGFVEFIASYLDGHLIKHIHELSEFKKSSGAWFYIDGKQYNDPSIKVSRNMPCPCGSGKKFKNCHSDIA